MTTTIKTASVLAFERKLDPSDGIFKSGNWKSIDNQSSWKPLPICVKSVRGTISNRLGKKNLDPAKLNANIQNPNIQTVDICSLPSDSDTLNVTFTLRVLSGVGRPSACNDKDYQNKLVQTIDSYIATTGLTELARRYAFNLANGRFLWRNRIGAEQILVKVDLLKNNEAAQSWVFDALSLSLRNFHPEANKQELDSLAKVIEDGLLGNSHTLLRVSAYVRLGEGQEVFPSQELILERNQSNDKKSKTLYQIDGIGGMHSQKIGNAIRTIDTWFPQAEEIGPIAVEPYGSVTTLGAAFRQPKEKCDFYSILDNWVISDKEPTKEDQHYAVAVLIRGGVFGEKE